MDKRGLVILSAIIFMPIVFASAPMPEPFCYVSAIINSSHLVPAYDEPCLTECKDSLPTACCPTDMELQHPARYYLNLTIGSVFSASGDTTYITCENIYKVGTMKTFTIDQAKANSIAFSQGSYFRGNVHYSSFSEYILEQKNNMYSSCASKSDCRIDVCSPNCINTFFQRPINIACAISPEYTADYCTCDSNLCVGHKLAFDNLDQYYASIDKSCTTDADCVVKDVGNCCGYYPMCTNKNANASTSIAQQICDANGLAGTCAFPPTPSCACVNQKCVSSNSSVICSVIADCQKGYRAVLKGQDSKGCPMYSCEKESCPAITPPLCPSGTTTQSQGNDANGCPLSPKCVPICPSIAPPLCPEGTIIESQGKDSNGCTLPPVCVRSFTNGTKTEVKIMPETASQTAIAQLGDLGFTVVLKEVGSGDEKKLVYELKGNKPAKIFGFIKAQASVTAQIDVQTGEILNIHKPWWAFLASGI